VRLWKRAVCDPEVFVPDANYKVVAQALPVEHGQNVLLCQYS
jgi:hypothetical protein